MEGAKKSSVPLPSREPLKIPEFLIKGGKFIKWKEDDSTQGIMVTLKVDKNGHYIYWKDQNKDFDVLELSCVRDTRNGKYAKGPKDPKLRETYVMGNRDIPFENKTLTVVYGPDFVNTSFLNFSTDKESVAKEWADSLLELVYGLSMQITSPLKQLEKVYTKVCLMTESDGKTIPVKNLIKQFSTKEDRKRVQNALQAAGLPHGKKDTIRQADFTFDMFFVFYTRLVHRQEVDKIFQEMGAKNKPYLNTTQLKGFINTQQRDSRLNDVLYPLCTDEQANTIIRKYEFNKSLAKKGHLSVESFLKYLMSFESSIVSPDKYELNQDMSQPLAHYFINSSHNTYLTGHQLTGRSSVEIYRQCLLAGCRCVELDCWDGDEEPLITHGYTMCTQIPFKDVIEAIAESAFKTSEYPVILSFENHCSPKQQAKMAYYLRTIMGDMLLVDTIEGHDLLPGVSLPSPDKLKGKIIVKNKKIRKRKKKKQAQKPRPSITSLFSITSDSSEEEMTYRGIKITSPDFRKHSSRGDESRGEEHEKMRAVFLKSVESDKMDVIEEDDESDSDEDEILTKEDRQQLKRVEGTAYEEVAAGEEMSALVNYVEPVRFHAFESAEKKNRSYEMSSFVETSGMAMVKEYPIEFADYGKRQLSRIYPKGTRVDSSNYMPQIFWNVGCQMVALNFQILDMAMQLNMGVFEYNGQCGYILKPGIMCRPDRRFDPFTETTYDGIVPGSLAIKIISGQFLSDKKVSTYVEVEMYGLPIDTVRKKMKTKSVSSNGINPIYDDKEFAFKKIVLPQLAMLRIAVYEESGKFLGHRILPVDGIQPGYRHLSLRNECNQLLTLPTLFVHICLKDYVPANYSSFADALANPIKYQASLQEREKALSDFVNDFDINPEDADKLLDENGRMIRFDLLEEEAANQDSPRLKQLVMAVKSHDSVISGTSLESRSNNGFNNRKFTQSIQSKTSTDQHLSTYDNNADAITRTISLGGLDTLSPQVDGIIQRARSAPAIRQDVLMEPFSVEDAKKNSKKYTKYINRREKEIQNLNKSFDKKTQKLKKKQEKKIQELESLHEKIKIKLVKKQKKATKKFEKLKRGDPEAQKESNDSEMKTLLDFQKEEMVSLKSLHEDELIDFFNLHLINEAEIYDEYEQPIYQSLIKEMNSAHSRQLKEVDSSHKKSEKNLQKSLEQELRSQLKAAKASPTKDQAHRAKKGARDKYIAQSVKARQRMSEMHAEARSKLSDAMQAEKIRLLEDHKEFHVNVGKELDQRRDKLQKERCFPRFSSKYQSQGSSNREAGDVEQGSPMAPPEADLNIKQGDLEANNSADKDSSDEEESEPSPPIQVKAVINIPSVKINEELAPEEERAVVATTKEGKEGAGIEEEERKEAAVAVQGPEQEEEPKEAALAVLDLAQAETATAGNEGKRSDDNVGVKGDPGDGEAGVEPGDENGESVKIDNGHQESDEAQEEAINNNQPQPHCDDNMEGKNGQFLEELETQTTHL